MIPVIISGGSGTRLWPVSRKSYPKQFCQFGDHTLFAASFNRLAPMGSPWVLTVEGLRNLSLKALQDMHVENKTVVLFEPEAKNTAPAIAYLLKVLEQRGLSQEIIGIFPADHLIHDEASFLTHLAVAEKAALNGEVVTLGILPTHPATGYGYIELKEHPKSGATPQACQALRFVEKPDLATAEKFLASGKYVWNAGMFVFKVQTMIQLFQTHLPEIWEAISGLKADQSNLKEVYSRMKPISIDYGIMEKLTGHSSVPCSFSWSDVGSWDSLFDSMKSEISQAPEVFEVKATGNLAFASNKKTVAFVGLDDVILIETPDATLVASRGQSESVKEVIEALKRVKNPTAEAHTFEVRPWGRFDILKDSSYFKSKIIRVDPKNQLSYQSHAKRAEHWIMVKGEGEVVIDGAVHPVKTGDHIFIPQGAKHRMTNSSASSLEFIEVQTGTYFGEDDIIRYQDDYNRQ